ncbi:UbiA family prenyltransferase [Candidatus Sumerlaeota bacterium]|nr:UbiA family prenyltransferase [Candidatus Sumerlaeota bacterium]
MLHRLIALLEMIRWQHTVFALPMALAAAALAVEEAPEHSPRWWLGRVALIVAAAFFARTAAMTHNRLIDRDIDATNPRTASRPSVTGEVPPGLMLGIVILCGLAFIGIAALLNTLALILSPLVLAILLGYSHAKRFTSLTHVWLGVSLGLAPVGAWIAILGEISSAPLLLGLSVVAWVAGFDILYAMADIEHDSHENLRSIPVLLGVGRSMALSALLHALSVALLITLGIVGQRGPLFALGVLVGAGLLLTEHRLIRRDLDHLPHVFLTMNGLFSLAILVGVVLDVWTRA